MEILIPVLICLAIAAVCAVILTLTSHFFSVKVDETEEKIRDCLAGANCGACGYSGCSGYATALSKGEAKVGLCPVGGEECTHAVGELLGMEGDTVKRVAHIHCMGTCDNTTNKADFQGLRIIYCNSRNVRVRI